MDSNAHQSYQVQLQHQHRQPNSGLRRSRSALGSPLANFTLAADSAVSKADPWEGAESERVISRFASYGDSNDTASASFQEFEDKASKATNGSALNRMNSQQGYVGLPPHYPRHNSATSSSAMDSSYGLVGSVSMDHEAHPKSFSSNLLRQSSSPAGLFSDNISSQNGYSTMKGVGNYGEINGRNGELSPSINRLKNQISFSSRSHSLRMLSQISELGSEGIAATSPDDGRQGNSNGDARHYGPGFPYGPWNNDTPRLSENLSGLKRGRDSNQKLFSDDPNGALGNQVHLLSHHLSLPKTSAEMVAMEKLLHFQDSVPCQIRAKRGCATHPRSIAERVRRTRISERMRKLQELVPNMDKQTSTADMLDLAVEYIKDLQKQFKTLSEKGANCKCISTQKEKTNQIA